jgi:hypothetical protein
LSAGKWPKMEFGKTAKWAAAHGGTLKGASNGAKQE